MLGTAICGDVKRLIMYTPIHKVIAKRIHINYEKILRFRPYNQQLRVGRASFYAVYRMYPVGTDDPSQRTHI